MGASGSPQSPIDKLNALRSEERALVEIIRKAKARGGAEEEVLRDHRRRLAQVRNEVDELLPRLLQEREQTIASIQDSRGQVKQLRSDMEGLRRRANSGEMEMSAALEAASGLQRQFEEVQARLGRQEHDLGVLDDFLPERKPGVSPSQPETQPAPSRRTPSGPPPVQRPAAIPPVVKGQPPPIAQAPPIVQAPPEPVPLAPDLEADAAVSSELLAPDDSQDEAPDLMIEQSRAVYRKAARRDRRVYPRVPLMAAMRYRKGGYSFLARSCDVSMGGMFFECPAGPAVGDEIEVVFCAAAFPVEIEARVLYETPGVGVGVRFGRLHDEDKEALQDLIREIQTGH